MPPKTWLVVCRVSDEFKLWQAAAIRAQFYRRDTRGWGFACLTDQPQEDWHIPLVSDLPGWWAIQETFIGTGPHILTGLDSIIMGDISPLLELAERCDGKTLYGIRDFYHPHLWASGVTAWNGDWRELFEKTTPGRMNQFRGNQEFTRWHVKENMPDRRLAFLNNEIDGILSYKRDLRGQCDKEKKLAGCRVCCFHGQPRPWAVRDSEPWLEPYLSLRATK